MTTPVSLRFFFDGEEPLVPTEFLVDDLLPEGGLAVLAGASNVGKSFLLVSLAVAVAAGRSWLGRTTVPGAVVYVSGEGSVGKRLAMAKREADVTGPLPIVSTKGTIVFSEKDQEKNEKLFSGLRAEAERADWPEFRLLILDTIASTFGGSDENSSAAMSDYIRESRHLSSVLGDNVAILLCHHAGWSDPRVRSAVRERGSSALRGAADTTIIAVPDRTDYGPFDLAEQRVRLSCPKMRDARRFKTFGVALDERFVADRNGQRLKTRTGVAETTLVVSRSYEVKNDKAAEEAEAEETVLDYIRAHPGCGVTKVREAVTGFRNEDVSAAIDALIESGHVVDDNAGKKGKRKALRVVE